MNIQAPVRPVEELVEALEWLHRAHPPASLADQPQAQAAFATVRQVMLSSIMLSEFANAQAKQAQEVGSEG